MQVRNANDQLLQLRFISGLRNDIHRFVLARDPNNLEESINAALIEEQNVKLNQIANDERTGLSPLQTETSVISALTYKLEEINLRDDRLDIGKRSVEKEDGRTQSQLPTPRGNAASEFSVFRHPSTHSFDRRRDHFQESAFRDNYAAPRHSTHDRHKTAFSTPDGDKYEFNRLCFGLKTRLKHFNQLRKRRYIKNFAKRALPLTNLLRKDTPFEWTSVAFHIVLKLEFSNLSIQNMEVHEQMSRFGGLSEQRPSVIKTRSKLGTHLSTQCSDDERQSRPCAAR
ncbi:hypothetical protein TNCV_1917551 [Trichonephila clavipes]|uniref:Uncharacterized protein n=1 Tax=Trichonephila clavipes TaxID=2585209 RepID=A0A8X6W0W0_TRICX|nr:hypothetical protein TNCV_1917551 [Trichonephila clavipes]